MKKFRELTDNEKLLVSSFKYNQKVFNRFLTELPNAVLKSKPNRRKEGAVYLTACSIFGSLKIVLHGDYIDVIKREYNEELKKITSSNRIKRFRAVDFDKLIKFLVKENALNKSPCNCDPKCNECKCDKFACYINEDKIVRE